MSRGYSLDLRQKVVEARNSGKTVKSIMEMFKLSRRTVYSYIDRNKAGNLQETIPDRKHTRRVEYNKVIEYVEQNQDKYLKEIAKVFNTSYETIRRILNQGAVTVKKKSIVQTAG